jgi:hypothetical protein
VPFEAPVAFLNRVNELGREWRRQDRRSDPGACRLQRRDADIEIRKRLTTAVVTRGDVVETVDATGTLQAVTTVQVGTQVSGTIKALYADFNSNVRRGAYPWTSRPVSSSP